MRNTFRFVVLLAVAAALSGCVEAFPTVQSGEASLGPVVAKPARSPRAASVALASLDGAPDAVRSRFDADFTRAAAARDVSVTDPSSARYLVRGYLSAAPNDSGTSTDVTFVYDIFEAGDSGRVDRVADTLTLPAGGSADAWALVDDRVMDSLVGRSADRLAAALAETPAARAVPAATVSASAAAGSQTAAVN